MIWERIQMADKKKESWRYLAEKAIHLRRMLVLLDGTLVQRLLQTEVNSLVYLLGLTAPDEPTQKRLDDLNTEWAELKDEKFANSSNVEDFANKLLSLISFLENQDWENPDAF